MGQRNLVGGQLGVILRVGLGDRGFGGLDVDHHRAAGTVTFEPVHPATQTDRRVVGGRRDGGVDGQLHPHLIEVGTRDPQPLTEIDEHTLGAFELASRVPARPGVHAIPDGPERLGDLGGIEFARHGLHQGVHQAAGQRRGAVAVAAAVAFQQPAQRTAGQRIDIRR